MAQLVAAVYVERVAYHVDRPFDYLVPSDFANTLQVGCRVLVPFGKANKKVQGLVSELREETDLPGQLKQVYAQLDAAPIITPELFEVIRFMVDTTFCCFYDAIRCLLPVGKNVQVVERYRLAGEITPDQLSELTPKEQQLVTFLQKPRSEKELNRFLGCVKSPGKTAVMQALLKKGLLAVQEEETQRLRPKTVRLVRIADGITPADMQLTAKQSEVIRMLCQVQVAMPKELAYLCGVTEGVIHTLRKKGYLIQFERQTAEPELSPASPGEGLSQLTLSPEQERVYQGLCDLQDTKKPQVALLHGVTGSGKTQVYIKLIERVLSQGRTAILLVPEISLTPQLLAKFDRLFGDVVGVIHSNLSMTERVQVHNRVVAGKIRVVIGTRSAIFAPLTDLGLVILDEEGELSYKSENQPRYHARELAKLRCVQNNALLLLGSATPSIDSYYRAEQGKYTLFTLKERYASAVLPHVYLVDMTEEQKKRPDASISQVLGDQLSLNLAKREQSILLLNRRGYQTFAACTSCGTVLRCPHCDVSLTYHKANGYMMCHYCGFAERFKSSCPQCGGTGIRLTGVGTQRVEDELQQLLPTARILRMDADTTYSRYSYEKNFAAFRDGHYDILLGTQMIAKGLDFPNVTLVGVLHADSGLYSTDFRSGERVFSLVTQVVGRSGRSEKAGRAYIQTVEPESPILQFAANQDFEGFYRDEIEIRRALLYPPFCDLVALWFSGENEEQVERAALIAAEILKENATGKPGVAMKVLGVTRAPLYKISNRYRYRIIMKCKLNGVMRQVIAQTLKACGQDRRLQQVRCYADVNGELS